MFPSVAINMHYPTDSNCLGSKVQTHFEIQLFLLLCDTMMMIRNDISTKIILNKSVRKNIHISCTWGPSGSHVCKSIYEKLATPPIFASSLIFCILTCCYHYSFQNGQFVFWSAPYFFFKTRYCMFG